MLLLHLDPTSATGAADAALHLAPVLAPLTTFAALALAALRGGR